MSIFYDTKISVLNTALTALGWIESVYGLVTTGVNTEGTYPELDGVTRIMPEGKSLSFFKVESAYNGINEEFEYETTLSLIVWADLTKVTPSKQYNYTSDLIKDCVNVLRENSCYDLRINLRSPFDGYSELDKEPYQNIALPYTGFKITFNTILLMGVE